MIQNGLYIRATAQRGDLFRRYFILPEMFHLTEPENRMCNLQFSYLQIENNSCQITIKSGLLRYVQTLQNLSELSGCFDA